MAFFAAIRGLIGPIYKLIILMQNKRAMSHKELFELMSCLEQLRTSFFLTWEDVSRNTDYGNIKDCARNVCVKDKYFKFIGNSAEGVK